MSIQTSVCVTFVGAALYFSLAGSVHSQDFVESYESARKTIRQSEGEDRIDSYLQVLDPSFPLSMEDRWKVLDDAAFEYGDQTENSAGRAMSMVYRAFWLFRKSEFSDAYEMLQAAKPWAVKSQDKYPQIWFCSLTTHSRIFFWAGDTDKSRDCAEAALSFAASCDATLHLNRPLRLLGLIAGNFGNTPQAMSYANKELEFGIEAGNARASAAAIQHIVGLLLSQRLQANSSKIRTWLKRGEKYVEGVAAPRLNCLYALRWAELAILEEDSAAGQKLNRYASMLEECEVYFRKFELASHYAKLSRQFKKIADPETAAVFAKKSRELGTTGFIRIRKKLMNAAIEIENGQYESAASQLTDIKVKAKDSSEVFEKWHRTSANLQEQQGDLKKALYHQREAERIAKDTKERAVFNQFTFFENLYQEKQRKYRVVAEQQAELLMARADLAVSRQNRIAIFALFGLMGIGFIFRLRFINRIKRESQNMNEKLAIELQERTSQLELEATRRHQLELDTERKQRHEAIGQLAAGVSHDFNNLLTVIGNAHQSVIQDESLTAEQQQLLNLASNATDRATSVVNQLMSFARGESLKVEQLSVQRWLHATQELLASTLNSEIEFVVDCSLKQDQAFINVDENQLSTAVINLTANARDAVAGNKNSKKVTLEIEKVPAEDGNDASSGLGDVCFKVTDNGEGIESELLPKILRPYVTTKQGVGTGLGLSMVAGFVERSGGRLQIVSDKGIGTEVSMYFPCVAAKSETTAAAECKPVTGGRILLVDDDELVRNSTAALLRSAGLEVSLSNSGDDAAKWLENNTAPDLVLSDIRMPGQLDGIKLRRHILDKYAGLPVVLMTGQTDRNVDGGTHVIEKPFKLQVLLAVCEKAILSSNSADRKCVTS